LKGAGRIELVGEWTIGVLPSKSAARKVLGNHHQKSPQRLETKHYGSSRLFPENRWHTGGIEGR
jgi:hypothetical protein